MGLARPDYGNNERNNERNDGGPQLQFASISPFMHVLCSSHFHTYSRDLSFPDFRCPSPILCPAVNNMSKLK